VATEPIVAARALAAHGSGTAVAEGMAGDDDTVTASTAAPPRTAAAYVARRPRRDAAVMDLIDALLTICERFGAPKSARE
jgi:hypothetical protein